MNDTSSDYKSLRDAGFLHLLSCGDPTMASLVETIGPLDHEARRRGRPDDAYGSLVRSIVGQQLSTAAARTIYGRLTALFDHRPPTPADSLAPKSPTSATWPGTCWKMAWISQGCASCPTTRSPQGSSRSRASGSGVLICSSYSTWAGRTCCLWATSAFGEQPKGPIACPQRLAPRNCVLLQSPGVRTVPSRVYIC